MNSSRKEGTKILINLNLLRRRRLGLFNIDFAVVGPRAVDLYTSSQIPRLLEEGSILLRQLFVHVYLCPLQVVTAYHDVSLHCIMQTFYDHWLYPFVSSSWQFMAGNNVICR